MLRKLRILGRGANFQITIQFKRLLHLTCPVETSPAQSESFHTKPLAAIARVTITIYSFVAIVEIIDDITTTITVVTISIIFAIRISVSFCTTVVRAIAIIAMIMLTMITICSFGTVIDITSNVLLLLTLFDMKLKQWTASRRP